MKNNKFWKEAIVLLIAVTMLFSTFTVTADTELQKPQLSALNINSETLQKQKETLSFDRGWLYYHNGFNNNAIGLIEGGTFEAAIRFTPDELGAYCDCKLSVVKFYHYVYLGSSDTHACSLKIYEEGTATEPGALIYTKTFTAVGEGYQYVTLCEPLLFDCEEDLWISIEVTHAAGEFPMGIDAGPAVDSKGDFEYHNSTWDELQDEGHDYNWCIEAFINCGEEDHKMHFPQMPDPNGWGVDFHDWMLGDDWECTESGPVRDIHFWISWFGDIVNDIPWIKISIFSNDPDPPYSKPYELLWQRTFDEGQFAIEGPWDGDQGWYYPPQYWPHDHELYWKINIDCIDDPFYQQACNIYWIVIEMPFYFPDGVGWKTTQDHFMDNAVMGWHPDWYPLNDPITQEPLDFAFIITTSYPPTAPTITGPDQGDPNDPKTFTFHSSDPDGGNVRYYIDWGDGTNEWTGWYPACTPVDVIHTYTKSGRYTITAYAEDECGLISSTSSFLYICPRDKVLKISFLQFLQIYLNWFRLLQKLL